MKKKIKGGNNFIIEVHPLANHLVRNIFFDDINNSNNGSIVDEDENEINEFINSSNIQPNKVFITKKDYDYLQNGIIDLLYISIKYINKYDLFMQEIDNENINVNKLYFDENLIYWCVKYQSSEKIFMKLVEKGVIVNNTSTLIELFNNVDHIKDNIYINALKEANLLNKIYDIIFIPTTNIVGTTSPELYSFYEYFFNIGINVNHKNYNGETIAHLLVKKGGYTYLITRRDVFLQKYFNLFIDYGLNIHAKTAKIRNQTELLSVIDYFDKYRINTPEYELKTYIEVKEFLNKKISKILNENKFTLLDAYIESKLDFRIKGETLLHIGVINKNMDFIKYLLDKNIQTNVKNDRGLTPIQLAMELKYMDIYTFIQNTINNKFLKNVSNNSNTKNILKKCINKSPFTLEDYTEDEEKDVITIFLLNGKNYMDNGYCISYEELNNMINSDLNETDFTDAPSNFVAEWIKRNKDKELNASGHGGQPGSRIFVKLPLPINLFVTFKSLVELLKNKDNQNWYAKPLFTKRVGNLFGEFSVSGNHGQIGGEIIYKLYTKPLLNSNVVKEDNDEYLISLDKINESINSSFEPLNNSRNAGPYNIRRRKNIITGLKKYLELKKQTGGKKYKINKIK